MKFSSYIIQSILLSIIYLTSNVKSQTACGEATTQILCSATALQTTCVWEAVSGVCKCKSEVKQDIFFGIDISGSIGWTDFQKEKAFLNELASQGVGASTRMGFDIFSSNTNVSRDVEFWDNQELIEYVNGIRWTGGYTNTYQVLLDAIAQYQANALPDRSRILLIVTDGVPCLSIGCPDNRICNLAPQLAANNIRVVVVGVGSGWTREYPRNSGITGSKRVECITAPGDVFEVDWDEFDTVLSSLSSITCPISKSFTLTEIKPMQDDAPKSNRFVEVYNAGVPFDTNDITFTEQGQGNSIILGTPSTNVRVNQSQYVVFYDAVTNNNGLMDVTCQQCLNTSRGGVCNLNTCSSPSSVPACYCSNSIYVPCGASSGNRGGYGCYFDNTNNEAAKTGWSVQVRSGVGDTGLVVDEVIYGASNPVTAPWTPVTNGYPYELIAKTANNDLGTSWREACDPRGTPGTDPTLDCPQVCTTDSCNPGGGSNVCDQNTGNCDCRNGTYPDGRTCKQVPGAAGNCTVVWVKNATTNFQTAYYSWSATDTSLDAQYQIHYYDLTQGGALKVDSTYQTYYKTTTHSTTANTTYPAFITLTVVVDGVVYKNTFSRILCERFISSAPTPYPTQWPTPKPSPSPTPVPTQKPTYSCPLIWMTGICGVVERCEACKQTPGRSLGDPLCCFRKNVAAQDPKCEEYDGDETRPVDLSSEGGVKQVAVKVYDEYPLITCANWSINIESITPGKSFTAQPIAGGTPAPTAAFTLAQVGIAIEPMQGTVCINGTRPKSENTPNIPNDIGFIKFNIIPLNCSCNATEKANNPSFCNDDNKCFEDWSATIKLRLHRGNRTLNEKDECSVTAGGLGDQTDCCTIVYPIDMSYSVTRRAKKTVVPTDESSLPPWIWWLIAALFIFLCLLAFLVYKFWWKAKMVGDSLATTQNDLDQAVAEAETGFAADLDTNNVGFNPLALGNQAGAMNPGQVGNPGMGGNPNGNPLARVPIEKFAVRQQFAAQQ